ncbi:MAG: acyl-CoA reductase [Bacteroidales bacterium]|nr:acyl-CoA reductase [Bacteroidales bacterium]
MINPQQLIHDLTFLGRAFGDVSQGSNQSEIEKILNDASEQSFLNNPWFIPSFVRFAFSAWANALKEEKIAKWINEYTIGDDRVKEPARVGLIMAGNIPMVGFHDLICVLASGNHALIKLSSSDKILIPAALKVLTYNNPEYENSVTFAEGPLKNFDAIIATGSNNSSRYFDYYFGKYPHIIRKNRNGIAVITGQETDADLEKLADDIFIYFGLGCRNVSKLYLPEGFEIERIFPLFNKYAFLADLHKYRNNYDYQKSLLLINRVPHLDNGFLLVKPDHSLISPISVMNTEPYQSAEKLNIHLSGIRDQIQCIVSVSQEIESAIPSGQSQFPELWDYADGVDTMEFLSQLDKNK